MSIVRTHNWATFCLHPRNIYTKMIYEFYAHLLIPENAFVYVREKLVLFDEEIINKHYYFTNKADEPIC